MIRHHFSSIDALRECADGRPVVADNDHYRDACARMVMTGPEWYGLPADKPVRESRAAFDRILREGYPTGRRMAKQIAGDLTLPRLKSRKRRRVRADAGDTVDLDMVRAGRLDAAWTRTARQATSAPPAVMIGCETCVSSAATPETLIWRGVVAWLLADKLQSAGYAVRVVAGNFSSLSCIGGRGPRCRITVDLKAMRSRVDPGALLVGLAHPATMRGLTLAAKFAFSERTLGGGCSYPEDARPGEWNEIAGDALPLIVDNTVEDQRSAQNCLNKLIGGLTQ